MNSKLTVAIILPLLFSSCATRQYTDELPYCSWSQDGSRWPTHQVDTKNFFIATALGLNEQANIALTGGVPKFESLWDIQGHLIEIKSNSNGIVGAIDTQASCQLTPNAFNGRQVGRYKYDELIKLNYIKRP